MDIKLKNGNIIQKERRCRQTYIGGSDIAAILGISKYRTPLQVYNQKIYGAEQEINIAMRVGSYNENLVLDMYEEEMSHNAGHRNFNIYSLDHSFMGAQMDWLSEYAEIGCDGKVTSAMRRSEYGEPWNDSMPIDIKYQVAYQRMLSGVSYVDVAVLFFPSEFIIYRYTENKNLESMIEDVVINFWNNNILKKCPPSINSKKEFDEMFPLSNSLSVDADEMILSRLVEIEDIKNKISSLESEKNTLKDIREDKELEIKKWMGANETVLYGGRKIASLPVTNRKSFTVPASSFRTLRISL
jgi:predicted phage-related endonuclease